MDTNVSDNQDLTLLDEQGKRGLWNQILAQIKVLYPVKIYPYIKEGQFISADNEEIVIGFPRIYNFHRSRLEDVTIKEEVERIIEKVSGMKINVAFVTIGGLANAGWESGAMALRRQKDIVGPLNGSNGEIIRESLAPIRDSVGITIKTVPASSNPVAEKTVATSNNIKSSNYLAGDDKRRLKEKVLQDERVNKILTVFEGKIVDVKKL